MADKIKDAVKRLSKVWDAKETRPVSRIDGMLSSLRKYWIMNPDLRLGQLIYNLGHEARPDGLDLFFIEDNLINNILDNKVNNIDEFSYKTTNLYNYQPTVSTDYTEDQLEGIAFKIAKDYKEKSDVVLDEYLNNVSFSVFNLSVKDSISVYSKLIKLIEGDTLVRFRQDLKDIATSCDYEIIS